MEEMIISLRKLNFSVEEIVGTLQSKDYTISYGYVYRLLKENIQYIEDEIRTLLKAIIKQPADLTPDYINNTLTVTIYPLANNRSQIALNNVLENINNTNTIYPESNLTLLFKIATI